MNSLLSKTLRIFAILALIQTSALAQVLVTITTSTPMPAAPLNVAYSQTLNATGGTAPYTWTVVSGALPQGLSLSTGGTVSGTPVAVTGNFSFTVQATGSANSGQASKALTIDVPPVITTTTLPNGLVQSPYSATVSAVPPTMGTSLTWSVSTGSLPAGLSINASTGTISGTPTAAGTSSFTVKATDSASQSSTANLSLTIEPVLTIPAATLPVAVVGSSYVFQLVANGPPSPAWAVVSGPLPPGITLSPSGSVSGTPTTSGSFPFTVKASTSNPTQTAQQSFTIVVNAALTITTPAALPNAPLSVQYSVSLGATGGLPPYKWTLLGGALPAGLTLSSAGVISGTPTSPGSFSFTAQVSDSFTPVHQVSGTFSITVTTPVTITTTSLPNAIQNAAYSQQLQAAGGIAPFSWAVTSGTLPGGLTLSPGGLLQGTPTAAGTATFTVKATDSASQSSTANLSLTIEPVLTIPAATLPVAVIGSLYAFQLVANGPPSPSWAVVSGSLPPGITLSSSGLLSGIPTTSDSFPFTVQASTSNPTQTARQSFILVVQQGITITTNSPLPLAVVSVFYSTPMAATGPSPLTWTIIAGSAPPGLSLTSTGTLTGTPTTAGTYDFTVQASSSTTPPATKAFTIVVNSALTITTLPALANAPLAGQYSVSLAATGGLQPYTWTLLGGALPAGLTLSSAGVISGTPTSPGPFSFTAQVSDSFMPVQQVSSTFSITVTTIVTVTTTSLPHAIQNAPYSQQLQATGTASFFWALTSGTLSAGLTLTPGGLLQGTPTSVGSQAFTVSVTDARGATSTQEFTLTVDPPITALSVILPASLNPTQVVSDVTLTLAAAHPSALTGQLILTFSSTAEVPSDDPATEFSSGSRTVSFTIPANATTAVFQEPIALLTGTVAGSIALTANVDNGPSVHVASSNVPATAPEITNITATRTGAGFDVQVVGYASARRVTTAVFTFDLQNGTKTSLSQNVDANFGTWYKNPTSDQYGSAFSYVQSFDVRGDVTQILDVTVQLTNAQGSTTSALVKLR